MKKYGGKEKEELNHITTELRNIAKVDETKPSAFKNPVGFVEWVKQHPRTNREDI